MKSVYLVLFLLFTTTAGFAQRIINVKLLQTKFCRDTVINIHPLVSGDTFYYDGVTKHFFAWQVAFLGPDSMMPGDTLYIKSSDKQIFSTYRKGAFYPGFYPKTFDTINLIAVPSPIILPVPVPPQTLPNAWTDSVWVTSGPSNPTITDPNLLDDSVSTPIVALMKFPASVKDAQHAAVLNIYPNPSGGILNIEFNAGSGTKAVSITLRDIIGKTVYQQSLGKLSGKQQHTIDVSGFTTGMYMAELDCDGQKTVSKVSIR